MATAHDIHRLMIDAWNRRDFVAFRNLLHADYSYTGGDGKEQRGGPDLGVAVAEMYANAMPDGRLELTNTLVQGSLAVAEFRATGTHQGPLMGVAPTGKRLAVHVCNVIEVRDGKIYREREYMDGAHVLEQLGVLDTTPED